MSGIIYCYDSMAYADGFASGNDLIILACFRIKFGYGICMLERSNF